MSSKLICIATILCGVTPFLSVGGQSTDDWDPKVLDLMRVDRRNAALTNLVKQGKYPPHSSIKEKPGVIKDVVVCPQSTGLPLIAVFLHESYDDAGFETSRMGHFMLITADGTMIPVYSNANSISTRGKFEDVNGDGVVDWVDNWGVVFKDDVSFEVLHVIPVTNAQKPSLKVLYDGRGLSWRSVPYPDSTNQSIQLGHFSEKGFEPVVEYKWSEKDLDWHASKEGGAGCEFMRVTGSDKDAAKALHASLGGPPDHSAEGKTITIKTTIVCTFAEDAKKIYDPQPEPGLPAEARKADHSRKVPADATIASMLSNSVMVVKIRYFRDCWKNEGDARTYLEGLLKDRSNHVAALPTWAQYESTADFECTLQFTNGKSGKLFLWQSVGCFQDEKGAWWFVTLQDYYKKNHPEGAKK